MQINCQLLPPTFRILTCHKRFFGNFEPIGTHIDYEQAQRFFHRHCQNHARYYPGRCHWQYAYGKLAALNRANGSGFRSDRLSRADSRERSLTSSVNAAALQSE